MKIGILTHQYINNYGAFLQAWALRKAISELFPEDEVQIIDYVNVKHYIINAGGWFRFYKNRETLKEWFAKVQLPNTFAKARNQEMILSKRCFNARQINELAFDCIVVGSDEVWNYRDTKGNAELKFGVGLTCKNLIAYAPSVGKTAADEVVPQYVIDGIRKFKRISARDDLTEQLVEQVTGKTPKRVLDPTFLAEFPRAELKANRRPYILFYYCENLPENILNQIFSYAKEHGLAVYGAGECDKRYSEVTVNLTPFEWVEMFRNAEFVFTGTFHGAVFSILNRRQFSSETIENFGGNSSTGLESRMIQLSGITWMLMHNAIFGLGASCHTRGKLSYYINDAWSVRDTIDNGYVAYFVEEGLLGGLACFSLFFSLLRTSWKRATFKNAENLNNGFFLCFLSYVAVMLSVADISQLLWVIIALYIIYNSELKA